MSINAEALANLIENSGISYKKGTVSYIFTCPRCSKKDKLYMRRASGQFICFYCAEIDGFKGRPEFALADLLGMSIRELKTLLYGMEGPSTSFFELELKDWWGEEAEQEVVLQPSLEFAADVVPIDHPHAARGLRYVMGRGLTLEMAKEYRLHYSPEKRRVIIPVYDGDRLIGWQARAVFETEWWDEKSMKMKSAPKILTSQGLNRDSSLMFSDRLKGSDHCVLTEGPFDAMKAHLCGGNVASMGKIVTQGQLEIIRNSGVRKIYVALDPDASQESMKVVRELSDLEAYRLVPPAGFKDLGEMTPEAVLEAFREAPRILPGQVFFNFRMP